MSEGTPMKMLISLALIMGLGLSACADTGKGEPAGSKNGLTVTETDKPVAGSSTTPRPITPKPFATEGLGEGPGPGGTAKPSPAQESPPPGAVRQDDAIYARVNENQPWGCRFAPGDNCKVPWEGTVALMSHPTGTMVFGAFVDGEKSPSTTRRQPITRGVAPFKATMFYTVPLAAKKSVIFQAWLLGSDGKILYRARPQTIPVAPRA